MQLSTTNLQCLTPLTLSFSFSLYPSCSLSFSHSLITSLHPPPRRNGSRNLTFPLFSLHCLTSKPPLASLSPFSLFTFSLRNPPGLTFPRFSLHFLTSPASLSPFSLFTFSLRNGPTSLSPFSFFSFSL